MTTSLADLTVTDSQTTGTRRLTEAEIERGALTLPDTVFASAARVGTTTFRVTLAADGVWLGDRVVTTGHTGTLSDMDWPLEFAPGTRVHVTHPRGGHTLRVDTA